MRTIKQLNDGYKHNKQLYDDFLNDKLNTYAEYFSNDIFSFKDAPSFPFYIAKGSAKHKKEEFKEAVNILRENYIKYDRDLYLDGLFWHSLLIQNHRDYILKKYPVVKESHKDFLNVVFKKFDWENYIYKSVLLADYLEDRNIQGSEADRYIELVFDNLDIYNYIIKYEVFRNGDFIFNLLDIIVEEDLSKIFKAQIKDRPDLGADERYGRRVIFELNKNYPTVMVPYLTKEELKEEVLSALELYTKPERKSILSRLLSR